MSMTKESVEAADQNGIAREQLFNKADSLARGNADALCVVGSMYILFNHEGMELLENSGLKGNQIWNAYEQSERNFEALRANLKSRTFVLVAAMDVETA